MKQRVANGEHVSISNNYSTVLVSFFRDFFQIFCIHSGILEVKGANRALGHTRENTRVERVRRAIMCQLTNYVTKNKERSNTRRVSRRS